MSVFHKNFLGHRNIKIKLKRYQLIMKDIIFFVYCKCYFDLDLLVLKLERQWKVFHYSPPFVPAPASSDRSGLTW